MPKSVLLRILVYFREKYSGSRVSSSCGKDGSEGAYLGMLEDAGSCQENSSRFSFTPLISEGLNCKKSSFKTLNCARINVPPSMLRPKFSGAAAPNLDFALSTASAFGKPDPDPSMIRIVGFVGLTVVSPLSPLTLCITGPAWGFFVPMLWKEPMSSCRCVVRVVPIHSQHARASCAHVCVRDYARVCVWPNVATYSIWHG